MRCVNWAFRTYIDKPLPAETWVQFHDIARGNRCGQSGTGPRFRPSTSVFHSQHHFPTVLYSCTHLTLTRMILAVDQLLSNNANVDKGVWVIKCRLAVDVICRAKWLSTPELSHQWNICARCNPCCARALIKWSRKYFKAVIKVSH